VFVEAPSWPLLVELAGASGLRLALLNARLSSAWFGRRFRSRPARALMGHVLERFMLIVPQSDVVRTGAAGTGGRGPHFWSRPRSPLPSRPRARCEAVAARRGLCPRGALTCAGHPSPRTLQDVGRFRILGATLQQMPGWCSDLKYAGAPGRA
jgi:hypothetical protein